MAKEFADIKPLNNSNSNSFTESKPRELRLRTNPLSEDYDITKIELGYGINGKVYKCINKKNAQEYALKVLRDSTSARTELELHFKVSDHRNIVSIIDVYENRENDDNKLYVVMEQMDGGELFDRIKVKKHFTEREAAIIVHQICKAVAYLHNLGIAHRDIKPENILFTSNSENAILKLTDFGFAKLCHGTSLKSPCYTPYYVAPEIISPENYDKSCDMWAIGVIIYIMLCGYPPFYSGSKAAFSPGMKLRIKLGQYTFPAEDWYPISFEAKELVKDLLKVDPKLRKTADEVIKDQWVVMHMSVPTTPLASNTTLNEEPSIWADIRDTIASSLAEMRLKEDISLKPLTDNSNNLFKRRKVKNKEEDSKIEIV